MSQAATYRYGNKNNWRRWAWNRIAEHCPVPKSEARVLYMPGPEDNDREIAKRHGFSDWNLIGVERDAAVARGLRRGGVIVVPGKIEAALSMQDTLKIGAPVCTLVDLLGDFSPSLYRSLMSANGFRGRPHVFVGNFLRGHTPRATSDDPVYKVATALQKRDAELGNMEWFRKRFGYGCDSPLHRGVRFYACCLVMARDYGNRMLGYSGAELDEWTDKEIRPVGFSSYRTASGSWFDSVAMLRTGLGIFRDSVGPLAREIAAAKALSTMQRRPSG